MRGTTACHTHTIITIAIDAMMYTSYDSYTSYINCMATSITANKLNLTLTLPLAPIYDPEIPEHSRPC